MHILWFLEYSAALFATSQKSGNKSSAVAIAVPLGTGADPIPVIHSAYVVNGINISLVNNGLNGNRGVVVQSNPPDIDAVTPIPSPPPIDTTGCGAWERECNDAHSRVIDLTCDSIYTV